MKSKFKFSIIGLSIIIGLINNKLTCQEDTLLHQNQQIVNQQDNPKIKYLDANLREEKSLIKFSILPAFIRDREFNSTFIYASASLSYEQKIIPSISLLFENQLYYGTQYSSYSNGENRFALWGLRGKAELRYYYAINKRIRASVGANNFNSNYFSLLLVNIYSYLGHKESISDSIPYYSNIKYGWSSKPYMGISWGIQRRIGNWGYFDIGPYYIINSKNKYIGLNLQLGLARGLKRK